MQVWSRAQGSTARLGGRGCRGVALRGGAGMQRGEGWHLGFRDGIQRCRVRARSWVVMGREESGKFAGGNKCLQGRSDGQEGCPFLPSPTAQLPPGCSAGVSPARHGQQQKEGSGPHLCQGVELWFRRWPYKGEQGRGGNAQFSQAAARAAGAQRGCRPLPASRRPSRRSSKQVEVGGSASAGA